MCSKCISEKILGQSMYLLKSLPFSECMRNTRELLVRVITLVKMRITKHFICIISFLQGQYEAGTHSIHVTNIRAGGIQALSSGS